MTHRSYLIMLLRMHRLSAYNWTLGKLNSAPMMNTRNSYVCGEELERVDEFTYLGSKIQLDGNVTSEVKAWIGKAAGGFNNLNKIWNQRNISHSIKVIKGMHEKCTFIRMWKLGNKRIWPQKFSLLKSGGYDDVSTTDKTSLESYVNC